MAAIVKTASYLTTLKSFVQSEETLKRQGYITQPLTDEELLSKRRCVACGKSLSQLTRNGKSRLKHDYHGSNSAQATIGTPRTTPLPVPSLPRAGPTSLDDFPCKFHPGRVVNKYWTCCREHVPGKPCSGAELHNLESYFPGELESLYQHYRIPQRTRLGSDFRDAVAIDCEMGTGATGDRELIRISVIDYFTHEKLMDNHVEPSVPMSHLNTKYSGVTWADIRKAKKNRTCIYGKDEARKLFCRYVGPDTLIIGHGASGDLRSLRLIHPHVVDSFLIEYLPAKRKEEEEVAAARAKAVAKAKEAEKAEEATRAEEVAKAENEDLAGAQGGDTKDAEKTSGHGNVNLRTVLELRPKQAPPRDQNQAIPIPETKRRNEGSGRFSLKGLVKKRVGRDIQLEGKQGHDSLEDAVGARDLIHWYVTHPEWESE